MIFERSFIMKKRWNIVMSILCVSALLISCGNKDSEKTNNQKNPEKSATEYKLEMVRPKAYSSVKGLSLEPGSTISIIGRNANDSYWKEVEKGAKQAVADLNTALGYKGSDKIKLTYSAPSERDDVNEQVNLLDAELDRAPAAIAIATIDSTACAIQFDLATENGIPIVTFDSGNDYQQIASHVSTDNLEATQTAAKNFAEIIGQEGEIIVFSQDSISTTATTRLNGFLDVIKENYPQISVADVYRFDELATLAQQISDEEKENPTEFPKPREPEDISQEDVIEYLLKKHPNLKGIYATNLDTTQAVAKILKKLDMNDVKFVGFDGGKEQVSLLESGVLDGIIVQNPYGMGYAAIVAAARVSLGLANNSFVNTGYQWVTPENMNTKKINKILY